MPGTVLRVGLTGGIATGKSYCLAGFAALGAAVISADRLARDVVQPGTPGLAEITRRFGPHILSADGTLDRPALATIVFADEAARHDLESIVHPAVYAGLRDWFDSLGGTQPALPLVGIADVPLLFETRHEGDFDRVVVAACSPATQLARLVARDRLSDADARARIAAQWPIAEKRDRADYVIDTDGTFADTDRQIAQIWSALTESARLRPSPSRP